MSSSPLRPSTQKAWNATSAASMPVFMALWLPLIRGRLTKPALQPISAPPGKTRFGSDCTPPSVLARAETQALTGGEHFAQRGVGLEALEFLERTQVGIRIIEMHHVTHCDAVAFEVIEETAATGAVVERPAQGMDHLAGLMPRRLDPPQLFEAEAELLHLATLAQRVARAQLFGERTARTFGDQRVFGVQLHARRIARLGRTVFGDAHVAGDNALDAAVIVIKQLGGGEARIDFHAQRLGPLAQPPAQLAQADDVITVVAHQRRHQRVRA